MGKHKGFTDLRRSGTATGEYLANTDNWAQWPAVENIHGKLPPCTARLGGDKSNATLAEEWHVSVRQASKIRNGRRPAPR